MMLKSLDANLPCFLNSTKFNMADYNNVPLVYNVNMVATARGFWNSLTFPRLFPDKCKISLTNGIYNKLTRKLVLAMETMLPSKPFYPLIYYAFSNSGAVCKNWYKCSSLTTCSISWTYILPIQHDLCL